MLYDPKWGKPPVDPMSLGSLISWLETKPPHETYKYSNCYRCLLGQYFAAKGFREIVVGVSAVGLNGRSRPLPTGFNAIAADGMHTFGAALERAKAMVPA